MRHRFAAALIILLYWTAIPSSVLAVEPRYPDSEGYKKCMASCNTAGTPENKSKLYLNSCDNVCVNAGADDYADLYITVVNASNGERIGAFCEVTGPGGFSESGDNFRDLKPGTYTVKVEMIYFLSKLVTVNIDPAQSKKNEITVSLQYDPNGPLGKPTPITKKDCPEQFCHGNTLHYNGQFDPVRGECVSNAWNCKLGCDPATNECIPSALELKRVTFDQASEGLILNGRHKIVLTGRATYNNPNNESVKGEEIAMQSVVPTADAEKSPGLLGVSSGPALVNEDGRFKLNISSRKPVDPKIQLKGLKLLVRPKDFPEINTEVKLVSPAPVIKKASLINKREMEERSGMWQDTYGVFAVKAEDPDNKIVSYTITAKHGTIRIYKLDWDGYKQKQVHTKGWQNWKEFEFGWRSPPITERLKLDLMKEMRKEWEKAAATVATAAVNELGKDAVGLGYNTSEVDLIDPEALGKSMLAARDNDALGANWQLFKYGLTNHHSKYVNAAGNVISAGEDLVKTYAEVESHTADQAAKMGEAYESGHEFYQGEMAARFVSIFLDGVKLTDGVYSFAYKATGKDDKSIPGSLKKALIGATIGSLQKGAEYVADTYKAAGARIKTLPFFIEVTGTDQDGYTGTRKIFVEVSGYESVIQ